MITKETLLEKLPQHLHSRAAKIIDKLYTVNDYGVTHQDPDSKLSDSDKQWLEKNLNVRLRHTFGDSDENGPVATPVQEMCVKCQARHIIEYQGAKDRKGNPIEPWSVSCNFVRDTMPFGTQQLVDRLHQEKGLAKSEVYKFLVAAMDPVKWAETMLGFDDKTIGTDVEWFLRSYQKEQLRCTSKRTVIREGRRSGKSFAMCLKLIYLLFTQEIQEGYDPNTKLPIYRGPRIMIVTPYQAQLTVLFDELEKLIKRNGHLAKQVGTGSGGSLYVKTPNYRLEIKDQEIHKSGGLTSKSGGSIVGFVSGVGVKSDGSAGGTMRGSSADWVYLDEMDMIPSEILDKVINPIRATSPNVAILATSTPIGARDKFYQWCVERPDWKSDYLPSSVLPFWDKIKDEVMAENTDEAFDAEYMAIFIEGAFGVFKPRFIQSAWSDIEYRRPNENTLQCLRRFTDTERENLIIVMGVDWNKNAGTEFVVVAYDTRQHAWYVVDASNITASKWTSEAFKRELVRLNHDWQCDFIYADKGYGHTIIEDLHLMSVQLRGRSKLTPVEHSTTMLFDTLKAFDFKANVDLKDPVTGQDIKKPGKNFLVENAVRVFESERISYPFSDQTLTKQLQNYRILKFSELGGRPIYGMESKKVGDHRLDALMLALGGLFLEQGHFSKSNFQVQESILFEPDHFANNSDKKNSAHDMLEEIKRAALVGDSQVTITEFKYSDNPETDALVRELKKDEQDYKDYLSSGQDRSRSAPFSQEVQSAFEYLVSKAKADERGRETDSWGREQMKAIRKRSSIFGSKFTRKKF